MAQIQKIYIFIKDQDFYNFLRTSGANDGTSGLGRSTSGVMFFLKKWL